MSARDAAPPGGSGGRGQDQRDAGSHDLDERNVTHAPLRDELDLRAEHLAEALALDLARALRDAALAIEATVSERRFMRKLGIEPPPLTQRDR